MKLNPKSLTAEPTTMIFKKCHSLRKDDMMATHTHSLGRMSERGEALSSERERITVGDHILCIWVLRLPFVLIISLRKLRGFLLYGFPEENYLSLVSCDYCYACDSLR